LDIICLRNDTTYSSGLSFAIKIITGIIVFTPLAIGMLCFVMILCKVLFDACWNMKPLNITLESPSNPFSPISLNKNPGYYDAQFIPNPV